MFPFQNTVPPAEAAELLKKLQWIKDPLSPSHAITSPVRVFEFKFMKLMFYIETSLELTKNTRDTSGALIV